MFNVVLVEPEIPPNTGSIGRLCLATRSTLHLVRPLGFSTDDRHFRIHGLDQQWPQPLHKTARQKGPELLPGQCRHPKQESVFGGVVRHLQLMNGHLPDARPVTPSCPPLELFPIGMTEALTEQNLFAPTGLRQLVRVLPDKLHDGP